MVKRLKGLFIKAGWAPMSVVAFHAGAAALAGNDPRTDPLMHFLGGMAAAYFLHHFLETFSDYFSTSTQWAHYLTVFCFTMTVAVLWEFAEYTAGEFLGAYSQLSLRETMGDLFLGCFGVILFIASRLICGRFRHQSKPHG